MYGRRQWIERRSPKKCGGYKKGNCPVRKGQILTVDIDDISPRGDGIAKIRDFAVFVPGTSVGDRVTIQITEIKTTCAEAKIIG
ncbi:MAG: TRAM domain-containing protein [Candidatus Aenigmarchaeota archaeon]|nr:TRAM domain-containing protein [Candidatus Aenigmarchaeota archaeon]